MSIIHRYQTNKISLGHETVQTQIARNLREVELLTNYARIASSPTQSSLRWKSAQLFHRTFDNGSRDDDKDHGMYFKAKRACIA